jgi:hypothetical protein
LGKRGGVSIQSRAVCARRCALPPRHPQRRTMPRHVSALRARSASSCVRRSALAALGCALNVSVLFVIATPLFAQNVYTIEVTPSEKVIPVQSCPVSVRLGRGKGGTTPDGDTLRIALIGANGLSAATAPVGLKIDAGKGIGGVLDAGKGGAAFAQGSGAPLRGQDVHVTLADGGYEICKASIPGTAEAEGSSLVLRLGPEFTSANGFSAKNNLGAAVGIRWDIGDRRAPAGGWGYLLSTTIDYTSAVAAHEYRSCRRSQVPRPLHPSANTVIVACAPKSDTAVVAGTGGMPDSLVYDRVLYRDSVRATTPAVWRAAITGRVEHALSSTDLRLGLVASVGVQPDPRGFAGAGFSNTNLGLHPYWSFGSGLRKVGADNTELFALDVMYGTVQNYFEVDAVQPSADKQADTVARFASEPVLVGDRLQFQAALRVRLFHGASIRAYTTFNGPTAPALVQVPGATMGPGFPDIVRIAFLLDRDAKDVWDTLVGTKGAKDVGQTNQGSTSSAGPAKP